MNIHSKDLKIAIFFGGPSTERDISLDSARTLYDSIRKYMNEDNINLYYVSDRCEFIPIGFELIYSNKVEDFLFKIERVQPSDIDTIITQNTIFCPMIHGTFGEDGKLTELLEKKGVKSILGSKSSALRLTLDKNKTQRLLAEKGFNVAKRVFFTLVDWEASNQRILDTINKAKLADNDQRLIVKPNDGGSSDGVYLTTLFDLETFIPKVSEFSKNILVEEFITGQEFSIIVLQDKRNEILPLYPTGIYKELDVDGNTSVYTRALKYMPGSGASHETPVGNNDILINKIRDEAISVFNHLEMSDWARFDGFITESNEIVWSDINGIPGYGQDSFFFQQSTIFSLSHTSASMLLLDRTANKKGILINWEEEEKEVDDVKTLAVVGGGKSSEKNVSRMSWANVIQKLNHLRKYNLKYIFQDQGGQFWDVPYFITLQHTIEEIEKLLQYPNHYIKYYTKAKKIVSEFDIAGIQEDINFKPTKIELSQIPDLDFVFIALHGGDGENGTIQAYLSKHGISHNGCDSVVSKICMDKSQTNQKLVTFNIEGFQAPKQFILDSELFKKLISEPELLYLIKLFEQSNDKELLESDKVYQLFKEKCYQPISDIQERLSSPKGLVFKPIDDGCSSGVVISYTPYDALPMYLLFNWAVREKIPAFFFSERSNTVEEEFLQMPTSMMRNILIEQLYEVNSESDLIELTVGVIGNKGDLETMLPSETVAKENAPLSVQEKFLKGGGINLTPPPKLKENQIRLIQEKITEYSNRLGLEGYARIDAFFDFKSDILYLIEVNSLPGLTAATIIYTQALLTNGINLRPSEFLDHLITLGFES